MSTTEPLLHYWGQDGGFYEKIKSAFAINYTTAWSWVWEMEERRATKAPPDIKMILWFLQEAENAFFWCIKLQATTKKVVPCAPLCRAERGGNVVRIGKAKQKFACRKMRLKYIGLWMLLEFKAKASARGDVVTAERLGASKSKAAYSSKLAIDGEFFEENSIRALRFSLRADVANIKILFEKPGLNF